MLILQNISVGLISSDFWNRLLAAQDWNEEMRPHEAGMLYEGGCGAAHRWQPDRKSDRLTSSQQRPMKQRRLTHPEIRPLKGGRGAGTCRNVEFVVRPTGFPSEKESTDQKILRDSIRKGEKWGVFFEKVLESSERPLVEFLTYL